MRSYSLVTCHFGDTFWIDRCIENVLKFTGEELKDIYIINQNRDQDESLKFLPKVKQVLEFKPNQQQISKLGHDHPHALDLALREIEFNTSHIIILDSDCFPISDGWINDDFDVQVAADPNASGLTHPCFMTFPTRLKREISFSFGIEDAGFDTGRLIGLQLAQNNEPFVTHTATKGFSGVKGVLYAGGKVFHFGSGSFAFSSDKRIRSINPLIVDRYFKRKILKNIFTLNFIERFIFSFGLALKTFLVINLTFTNKN